MIREVKCKQCGKIFKTEDKRRKFCDDNCRVAYYNAYRKEHQKEVLARYLEDDEDRIKRYQKKRRDKIKKERYKKLARIILKICNDGISEDNLADYLMDTFNGVKKGE